MNTSVIFNELSFKAVRSSGAGGQNVNKVSSKIELSFNVMSSMGITEEERIRISNTLKSRITKSGDLILQCSDTRSQHKNKELVIKRFFDILKVSTHVPKKRKASRPSKSSIRKRLESKQRHALKKANRKKPEM